jgi:hypothetical protein
MDNLNNILSLNNNNIIIYINNLINNHDIKYNNKCDELALLKSKYESDIVIKNNEIKSQKNELTEFNSVSLIKKYDKELTEKINYILILESQLDKYKIANQKNKAVSNNEPVIVHIKQTEPLLEKNKTVSDNEPCEKVKNSQQSILDDSNKLCEKKQDIEPIKQKKVKTKKIINDVNGFELIEYKKKHYMRDLETNELYNILDDKPNQVIGLINSKGKVKLN